MAWCICTCCDFTRSESVANNRQARLKRVVRPSVVDEIPHDSTGISTEWSSDYTLKTSHRLQTPSEDMVHFSPGTLKLLDIEKEKLRKKLRARLENMLRTEAKSEGTAMSSLSNEKARLWERMPSSVQSVRPVDEPGRSLNGDIRTLDQSFLETSSKFWKAHANSWDTRKTPEVFSAEKLLSNRAVSSTNFPHLTRDSLPEPDKLHQYGLMTLWQNTSPGSPVAVRSQIPSHSQWN